MAHLSLFCPADGMELQEARFWNGIANLRLYSREPAGLRRGTWVTNNDFMQQAIELAIRNVEDGGGPFGAVIVKSGTVVATGVNRVTTQNDPTAHAEIVAIREACRQLDDFQLTGCEIYTSCEPCPMCLGAIYWARPDRVYYAATHRDAANAGFDDSLIYEEISKDPSERRIEMIHVPHDRATDAFKRWQRLEGRKAY